MHVKNIVVQCNNFLTLLSLSKLDLIKTISNYPLETSQNEKRCAYN